MECCFYLSNVSGKMAALGLLERAKKNFKKNLIRRKKLLGSSRMIYTNRFVISNQLFCRFDGKLITGPRGENKTYYRYASARLLTDRGIESRCDRRFRNRIHKTGRRYNEITHVHVKIGQRRADSFTCFRFVLRNC